jgi:hypothetical protein
MSKHGGEQTTRRPHWSLLGLLLVVLLLGHDILMASHAVAAPHPAAGTRSHGTTPSELPGSGHLENCGVWQVAVPRSGDDLPSPEQVKLVGGSFSALSLLSGCPSGHVVWEEPHWPPGTLRALFQVYRN